MDAGQVALLHFPFNHREQQPFKRRPVLVIGQAPAERSADAGILVAMITSSSVRVTEPGLFDVSLDWKNANLSSASVCRTNRLWVAEPADFDRVIGNITDDELATIKASIRNMFAL